MKTKVNINDKPKVIFSGEALKKALSFVGWAIVDKPINPVMEMVKVIAANGLARMIGTDSYTTVSTQIPVDMLDTQAVERWLMPYDLIKELVATFGTEQVTIVPDFTGENGHIVQYGKGFYKLQGDTLSEFPGNDRLDGRTHVSKLYLYNEERTCFIEALRETMPFVGKDDLRPALTGVGIVCKDGIGFAVASDAFALRKYPFSIDPEAPDFVAIVRAKFAAKVALMSDEQPEDLPLELDFYKNMIRATIGKNYLQAQLIDENYPGLEAAIPSNPEHICGLVRESLTASLKRMQSFYDKTTHSVALQLKKNQLTVWTMDRAYSKEAEDTLEADYEGPDLSISFNGKYLLMILNRFEDSTITFGITAHNRAVLVWGADESIKTIVMPLMTMPGQDIDYTIYSS